MTRALMSGRLVVLEVVASGGGTQANVIATQVTVTVLHLEMGIDVEAIEQFVDLKRLSRHHFSSRISLLS